jgi:hypothetical protein
MSTQAQLAANRQNAQLSTGPKTPEGKAASSQNALTHGLYASAPLLPSENPSDFQALLQSLHHELHPAGPLQSQLVHRIASLLWKLRRVAPAESHYINRCIAERHHQLQYANHNLPRRERLAVVPPPSLEEILAPELSYSKSRLNEFHAYELRLERDLHETLRQLAQLQKSFPSPSLAENEPNSAVTPCQSSTPFSPTSENVNLDN